MHLPSRKVPKPSCYADPQHRSGGAVTGSKTDQNVQSDKARSVIGEMWRVPACARGGKLHGRWTSAIWRIRRRYSRFRASPYALLRELGSLGHRIQILRQRKLRVSFSPTRIRFRFEAHENSCAVCEANSRQVCILFWNTMEQSWVKRRLQVFENLVELVGIEPTTSSLRTMRSPS
jgi:hypothetical protein